METDTSTDGDGTSAEEHVDLEAVREQLETLEGAVDDPHERREVQRTIGLLERLPTPAVRDRILKYTKRDIAESFVGSVLISLPMLVEDGVFTIAEHFLAHPVLFACNVAFVVAVTGGMIYYADFRDVQVSRPLFGIIPRRLAGVLAISFLTAALTMTLWGRIDGVLSLDSLARVSVVWSAAALGGALGDILPGESKGDDINDHIDEFGERIGIGDEEGRF